VREDARRGISRSTLPDGRRSPVRTEPDEFSGGTLSELAARLPSVLYDTLERAASSGMLGSSEIGGQVAHALGFACAFEHSLGRPPASVVDLGTGGGLPGLVLHALWRPTEVVLLDASERRSEFLRAELDRWRERGGSTGASAEVVRGRAEEIAHESRFREHFEGVSSRSFGRPAIVSECGAPFLRTGGVLVVSEPPSVEEPDRWAETGLAEVGLGQGEAVRIEGRFNYRVLRKTGTTSERYPRRSGVPAKRPLF
jgi:16S rRNA (guanine527-N7)-methyltransferase